MASKNVKKRNWAAVLYPESLPSNWRQTLIETGLQCVISPLHDRDVNPDGTPKKPHYHVILCYSGPTSYNVVLALVNGVLGQPRPQPLEQIRGYYRYLTHMDNPEKYQYSESDIEAINGFNVRDYVPLTETEIDKILWDIQGFVEDNNITEYADLMEVLRVDGFRDWWSIARRNTVYLQNYIKSRKFRRTGGEREKE